MSGAAPGDPVSGLSAEPDQPNDRPSAGAERQPDPSPEATPPRVPARPLLWPWLRALLALPIAVLGQALVAIPLSSAIGGTGGSPGPLFMLATYAGPIALLFLSWRFVTKEPLVSLGHAGPPRRVASGLLAGVAVGGGLMALVVGAGQALGAWSVSLASGPIDMRAIAAWSAVLAVAAYFEELLLRGHVMQELGRKRPAVGLILSSLIFALVHVGNPDTMSGGTLPFVLLIANITFAGVLLGAAYLQSGDLWLPTGVHYGWNWAQSLLFGLPVSGMDLPSLLRGSMTPGAPSWAGSAFGPESSLPAFAFVATAGGIWAIVLLRRGARVPSATWAARQAPAMPPLPAPTETAAASDGDSPFA